MSGGIAAPSRGLARRAAHPGGSGGRNRGSREARELLDLVGFPWPTGQGRGSLPYGHQRRLRSPGRWRRSRACSCSTNRWRDERRGDAGCVPAHPAGAVARVTILLIEHDMSLVMKACDRLVVFNFGRKIAEGTPAEIRDNPQVIEHTSARRRGADA